MYYYIWIPLQSRFWWLSWTQPSDVRGYVCPCLIPEVLASVFGNKPLPPSYPNGICLLVLH